MRGSRYIVVKDELNPSFFNRIHLSGLFYAKDMEFLEKLIRERKDSLNKVKFNPKN